MDDTLQELSLWLSGCKYIPPKRLRQRTLLDIAGINHRENSWSDIYAYFFNPKEKHKLGHLFIDAFNTLIAQKSGFKLLELESFTITREKVNDDKKQMDLLIKNEEEAIIIENKVYAKLDNNDLLSYWECVKVPNKRGIVLSLYKIKIPNEAKGNFINITHKEFADEIIKNIPIYFQSADSKSLLLLQEFIQNIYNETYAMNEEELKFYYQNEGNRTRINRLSEIRSNVINHVRKSVEGENKDDRNNINYQLKEKGVNLKVENKDNNCFTYYYYENNEYSGLGEIMLTLKYDSLWNYETNGCRIDMFLEVQGNMLKFVESHKELLKEKGIESDQQATPQNGWWHFQKDEIRFETDELINQDSIREKIIEGIKNSPLYSNGLKIIEFYTNH